MTRDEYIDAIKNLNKDDWDQISELLDKSAQDPEISMGDNWLINDAADEVYYKDVR